MEDYLLLTQQEHHLPRYFIILSNDKIIGIYDTFVKKPTDVIQENSHIHTNLTWKYVDEPVKMKKD
jgi:hypothetical protein